jgi:hypothetical protein
MLLYFAETELFENLNIKNKSTAVTEIVIMLVGSFLLGYLLHWLICRARGHKTGVVARSPRVSAAPRANIVDDLKIVEGIGPKIEELLNDGGIMNFAQLANAPASKVQSILDKAGPRYQMHDPESWAKQAALARDGKMVELEKLQDRLNGGR